MSYAKVVYYADVAEVTVYEKDPVHRRSRRASRKSESSPVQSHIPFDGEDVHAPRKQTTIRTEGDARRAVLAFRRICHASFARFGNPVFASITYAKNMEDVAASRQDWNSFATLCRRKFGSSFRYICTTEFQKRGAVHFHAFFWGLPLGAVETERHTRMVAALWGRGYVDIINTDGSPKLATYMSKYASKHFLEPRLQGFRVYMASRDIARPVVDKGAVLSMYHGHVDSLPDISTGLVLHESEYDAQWLGRANYKKYKILKAYAQGNA